MERRIDTDSITIRPLASEDDFQACVGLQYATWGPDFSECVPPSILLAVQEVGGVAAGAFDTEGHLLGFVFGMSGVRSGRPAHWSDMLAVQADVRGQGLGVRLKTYQRDRLLEMGIEVAHWTYDPLEARNAHININRLGALPARYVTDMYGEGTGSRLHSGLGTDRFIVEWELRHPRVEEALSRSSRRGARSAASRSGETVGPAGSLEDIPLAASEWAEDGPRPAEPELLDWPRVRVEVPRNIQRIKADVPDAAAAWRSATRRAFVHYMDRGYAITDFVRQDDPERCFYLVQRKAVGT